MWFNNAVRGMEAQAPRQQLLWLPPTATVSFLRRVLSCVFPGLIAVMICLPLQCQRPRLQLPRTMGSLESEWGNRSYIEQQCVFVTCISNLSSYQIIRCDEAADDGDAAEKFAGLHTAARALTQV